MGSENRRRRLRPRRHRITWSDSLAAVSWMTDRDFDICNDLYRHLVMITHQLAALHFTQLRQAEKRLKTLYDRGLLERFQPWRPTGSAPYHYILDDLGAHVLAGHYDLDVKYLLKRLDRDRGLAHSRRLDHILEINDFFVDLICRCREAAGCRLLTWWSEHRCDKRWRSSRDSDPLVRPDAQGLLQGPNGKVSFFLEIDRGTERGAMLTNKLEPYAHVARMTMGPGVLLFLFPSANRELHARRKLHPVEGLVIATSHQELHERDPLGCNWKPLDSDERVPLIELRSNREKVEL